jgi:dethiobiotin synthetase
MTALFITATGTEVGKTFLSCGLIHQLRAQQRSISALKPVISGFDAAHPEASDSGALLAALGRPPTIENVADISPWRFAAPLSPDMAARREGRTIDLATLIAFCRKAMAQSERLLIEGIGGLMVPLDDGHTVLDWIEALDVPVILVAGSYLGTLSHTLTALEVLEMRARKLVALVVSESEGSSVPLSDTLETLQRLVPNTQMFALPRLAGGRVERSVFTRIADAAFPIGNDSGAAPDSP